MNKQQKGLAIALFLFLVLVGIGYFLFIRTKSSSVACKAHRADILTGAKRFLLQTRRIPSSPLEVYPRFTRKVPNCPLSETPYRMKVNRRLTMFIHCPNCQK